MSRPVINYTESNIPSHLKLHIKHLHKGNSGRKKRHGKDYSTVAILYDRSTGDKVAEARSFCSEIDVPNRNIGRMVAIGRALKNYFSNPLASSKPF